MKTSQTHSVAYYPFRTNRFVCIFATLVCSYIFSELKQPTSYQHPRCKDRYVAIKSFAVPWDCNIDHSLTETTFELGDYMLYAFFCPSQ